MIKFFRAPKRPRIVYKKGFQSGFIENVRIRFNRLCESASNNHKDCI